MARTLSKNTIKALNLLDKPHPKYPNRRYTPYEAAQKTGVGLSTIYKHIKVKSRPVVEAAQQNEGNDMGEQNKIEQQIDTPEFWALMDKYAYESACEEFDKNQYDASRKAILEYLANQSPAPIPEQVAQEEIRSLHRQVASEKLRADQGWQRAEAKSKECIELRERMASQASVEQAPVAQEVTQHAAKAETAETANVLPPFAEPAGQLYASIAKLEKVAKWINKFPVPTDGATTNFCRVHEVIAKLQADAAKVEAVIKWLNSTPHGDNCFVSDHYEGDPGNRCNCGKDSLLEYLESGAEKTRTAGSVKGGSTNAESSDLVPTTSTEPFQQKSKSEAGSVPALLGEILSLAELGVSYGLLADDYCSQIVSKIKDLAPTTSTVSASGALAAADDVRNLTLEEAAKQCEDIYSWRGAFSAGLMDKRTLKACADAIRALRTTAAQAATDKSED